MWCSELHVARRGVIMALLLWLVFIFNIPTACCDIRQAYMKQTTGQECQTLQIGESWSSGSALECYRECAVRFPDSCQSIVYTTDNQSCTPGSAAFRPLENVDTSIPVTGSNGMIFYKQQPIPPCNTNGSFSLYNVCGTTACLYLSSSVADYHEAVSICSGMNSRMFFGNTLARFSVFWEISLKYLKDQTWIGLNDLDDEDTYVWENGEPLSDQMAQWVFRPGYPNDYTGRNDEDCAEARHRSWPGIYGLNDAICWYKKLYMCEPFDAYGAK
ncbi:hypothetical protein RRG08_066011 [Elysia crispata]|uniref:C-type lectin domain-containing protein n=1 Tax=Elysia crispata TaxID=231223 RepID=A0AAE1E706_9GAST|nr:hypothetical protein RRG08_066011 [Elysia crispata]